MRSELKIKLRFVREAATMVDTKIRHVTKPQTNLFLELGFSPVQARCLQAELRKQIDEAFRAKKRRKPGRSE
jgi:hypothetical protein